LLAAFQPASDVTVSEWAADHRVIARGNAEPGKWSNARAPYVVEPFDSIHDDGVHTVVITGCSQSGKTEGAVNVVGWAACNDPCTAIWAAPSDAGAMTAASRFDAAIDATPELKKRFGSRTARSTINNTSLKEFVGGKLVIVSAGSPSSLASHPARLVIADEVDRFPVSLRKEGDPIGLLRARMTTFARRKFIAMSSPTQLGSSRIEALFAEGDQRDWHWRCDCGEEIVPDWSHVEWTPGAPLSARYHMPCCGLILDDAARWRMMQRGRWIATGTGLPGVRSYRFRGLSSPWIKLSELAQEFEAAKGSPIKLAPWWNTKLGLPFETDIGEGADADQVKEMAEEYPGHQVPRGAALVTAGIDVQAGWIAVSIVAWGDGDEGWPLQWHEVQGEARDPRTWEEVAKLLEQSFRLPSGGVLPIEAVAIDAGFETQSVYEFSQKHRARGRKWFATKGMAGPGRALWTRGGDITRSLARFFLVGVNLGKAQVLSGLAMADPGAGRIHSRREFPEHWWQWATAEEQVQRETAGGVKVEWRMKRGQRRNEVLDTLVLALAARYSADFDIPARLERLHRTGNVKAPPPDMGALAARIAAVSAP
jgi:phage terminase large subunit GpA-like protein